MIMKKLAKISALLFAVVLIATGCKKLPEFTDGSSSTPVTPTQTGTLYYRLNGDPIIGTDFISISAKYGSSNEITEMALQVSEDITMNTNVFINTIDFSFPELSGTVNGLQPNTHYYWCISYFETGLHFLTEPEEFTTLDDGATFAELIIGRWKTEATMPYYEVYNSDGTGKMWNTAEGVSEDEADTFNWSIDGNKLTQIISLQGGSAAIPQYCIHCS